MFTLNVVSKLCKRTLYNSNNICNQRFYIKSRNNQYQDKFESQFEDKYKSKKVSFKTNNNKYSNNNNNNNNHNNHNNHNNNNNNSNNKYRNNNNKKYSNNNNNNNNKIHSNNRNHHLSSTNNKQSKPNYQNEVLIVKEHNIKGEALYGINPVWVAITSDNRDFNQLYITKSIYEKVKSMGLPIDSIKDDTELKLKFGKNQNASDNDNDGDSLVQDQDEHGDDENDSYVVEGEGEDYDLGSNSKSNSNSNSNSINSNKFNRYNDKKNLDAIKEIILKSIELKIPIIAIKNNIMESFSKNKPHQGIILDCSPLTVLSIDFLKPFNKNNNSTATTTRFPLWIVLDELWDPQNVGAIIRSCSFFNVDGIVISDKCSNPITPTASKCSSGAVENYLIHKSQSINGFLISSKKNGWRIIGTSVDDQLCENVDVTSIQLDQPTILIIGNEGFGIHQSILNQCDKTIKISGGNNKIDSLNVSVSTGILVHSLLNSIK